MTHPRRLAGSAPHIAPDSRLSATSTTLLAKVLTGLLLIALAACSGSDSEPATSSDPSPTETSGNEPAATTALQTTTTTDEASTTTSSTTTSPPTTVPDVDLIDIDLTAGDDPGRVAVDLGRNVRLTVTADVSDEVHLHGYDIKADVGPGAPAVIEFVADIPGIFEVELEGTGQRIVELEVSP